MDTLAIVLLVNLLICAVVLIVLTVRSLSLLEDLVDSLCGPRSERRRIAAKIRRLAAESGLRVKRPGE